MLAAGGSLRHRDLPQLAVTSASVAAGRPAVSADRTASARTGAHAERSGAHLLGDHAPAGFPTRASREHHHPGQHGGGPAAQGLGQGGAGGVHPRRRAPGNLDRRGSASRHLIGIGVIGGMLAATILAIIFVPPFFGLATRSRKNVPNWAGERGGPETRVEVRLTDGGRISVPKRTRTDPSVTVRATGHGSAGRWSPS